MIIAGAGHSGARAAAALRKHGWTGGIVLVGNESHLPYDRPPLSKAVLLGKRAFDACSLYPAAWYEQNKVELVLNTKVERINRADASVTLETGECRHYHRLILATGSSNNAFKCPGADLRNVWPLRTPGHAREIAASIEGKHLVVIGAGVIGLEVAAAARERGGHVTVVEPAQAAMGRSLPLPIAKMLIERHRQRGVNFRFGMCVTAIEGHDLAHAVVLSSGERLRCDVVVYGIGARANAELAENAGLLVDNGIVTNARLQTDDPAIFACGDACSFHSELFNRNLRLENWRNAEDQADVVARNVLGQEVVFDPVPWFWSNQLDVALQVAGMPNIGAGLELAESGSATVFVNRDACGVMCGGGALGPVRDVAGPVKRIKEAIAGRVRSTDFLDAFSRR